MMLRISHISAIFLLLFILAGCKPSKVQETATVIKAASDEKAQTGCEQRVEEIKLLLNDLTTSDKIDNIVEKASAIPFDTKCGKIHETLMYTFKKYGFYPKDYKRFLLNTLASIEYPGLDDRAYEIIKYQSSDGKVDDEEWKMSLKAIQRSSKHYLSRYLRHLLYGSENNKLPADEKVTYERVDELFDLAKDSKVGLPVTFPFDYVFFQMLDAGYPRRLNFNDTRILRYTYEKYNDEVPDERRPKLFNFLKNIYLREQGSAEKEKILNWIEDHFKERKADEDLAEDMMKFAKLFSDKNYVSEGRAPKEDFNTFIDKCRDTLAKALPFVKNKYQKKERILFCLEHGIAIPGFVPTAKECEKEILSDNYNKQREYMEYLEAMGPAAKDAKNSVLKMISRVKRQNFTGATNLELSAISVLGNIKAQDPKSLKILTDSLASNRYKVADAASQALVKIGKPALPYLAKLKAMTKDKRVKENIKKTMEKMHR